MRSIAFLIMLFDLLWGIFVIGGCAYLVFFKGHSGWWFSLAVMVWVMGLTIVQNKEHNNERN